MRLSLWIVESRYWSAGSVRMSKVRSQRMNRTVVGQVGAIVRDQEILLHQARAGRQIAEWDASTVFHTRSAPQI